MDLNFLTNVYVLDADRPSCFELYAAEQLSGSLQAGLDYVGLVLCNHLPPRFLRYNLVRDALAIEAKSIGNEADVNDGSTSATEETEGANGSEVPEGFLDADKHTAPSSPADSNVHPTASILDLDAALEDPKAYLNALRRAFLTAGEAALANLNPGRIRALAAEWLADHVDWFEIDVQKLIPCFITAFTALLEYHHLKNHNASWAEHFFSLKLSPSLNPRLSLGLLAGTLKEGVQSAVGSFTAKLGSSAVATTSTKLDLVAHQRHKQNFKLPARSKLYLVCLLVVVPYLKRKWEERKRDFAHRMGFYRQE